MPVSGLLAALADELPQGAPVADPDVMDPYRRNNPKTVVPGQPCRVKYGVTTDYALVTFDRHDPAVEDRAAVAFDEVMEAPLGLGGTVTGEHGVGSLPKAWHLAEQLGPDVLRLTRAAKTALDRHGILNPAKWV